MNLLRSESSIRYSSIRKFTFNFNRKEYEPRGGIRLKSDLDKEKKENKNEEDPFKYNFYGGRKLTDMFFYSDRTAGKGYSDYANSFPNKPYVWPPFRKMFSVLNIFCVLSIIILCVDFEWLVFLIVILFLRSSYIFLKLFVAL